MTRLFAATLFLSAALLFLVQPMIGRLVLPRVGGAPAVWTTCLLFFQAAMLGGYLYAHGIGRLGPRVQVVVHAALLLTTVCVLGAAAASRGAPIGIPQTLLDALPTTTSPTPWLLMALLATIGLPFFVLAASAPLLQRWFSSTDHPAARDPYFLYGASNVGSLLALIGYPLLLEPRLGLRDQGWLWTLGFLLLVGLVWVCAGVVLRVGVRAAGAGGATGRRPRMPGSTAARIPITAGRRARWLALAFVPSSLLLGVTTYLSTDIAPIPLLWVLPLAIYLATFALVFARRPPLPHRWMDRALPGAALLVILVLLWEATEPAWVLVTLHLLVFFVASMICHGELARDRPAAEHLTEFYLWMSLGGVLGGLFNALLAPAIFLGLVEYPLALVLACLLRPAPRDARAARQSSHTAWPHDAQRARILDVALPVAVGLLAAGLVLVYLSSGLGLGTRGAATRAAARVGAGLVFGVPLVVCYLFSRRPVRFALGLAAVLLASMLYPGVQGRTLHAERNFFGIVRVTDDPAGAFHRLVHGTTIHGRQRWDPDPKFEPLSYYHPSGPVGDVFQAHRAHPASPYVAIVGLGAGSLACYARAEEYWSFYEIDPAVERIARDARYFTFLRDAFPEPARLRIEIGDARLRLAGAPPRHFGLIVLDAFSSDAIPAHLLTREALALYLEKLAPGGVLAFHISNRYVDFHPVLANLAHDADPRLVCLQRDDTEVSPEESRRGKQGSQWVVMARAPADLAGLGTAAAWRPAALRPDLQVWTDDFSSLWAVLRLR